MQLKGLFSCGAPVGIVNKKNKLFFMVISRRTLR
jgi:hypothetical protein